MDLLSPTKEEAKLLGEIEEFAAERLKSSQEARSQRATLDLWRACATQGVLGLCVDPKYGGSGFSIGTTIRLLETLGRCCSDNGLTLSLNGAIWAVCKPLLGFGTELQKSTYLPRVVSGEAIGCFALNESNTGSDALSVETSAMKHGDGYVLNGKKTWIGMAPAADFAIVFAQANPENKNWGVSAFIVEQADSGASFAPAKGKMGLETALVGDIELRDCYVNSDRLLGTIGAGQSLINYTMEWERSFIFSSHVGSMARQLLECVGFARERETFGRPIIEHQSVSNRLADMRLRLETSRLMLFQAAAKKDQGHSIPTEAAMNKLHIGEAFLASSIDAARIFGSQGYSDAAAQGQDVRDSIAGVTYSGTSDIQRQIIARLL